MTSQLRTVAMFVILTYDLVDDLRARRISRFQIQRFTTLITNKLAPNKAFALPPCFRYTLYWHMTL